MHGELPGSADSPVVAQDPQAAAGSQARSPADHGAVPKGQDHSMFRLFHARRSAALMLELALDGALAFMAVLCADALIAEPPQLHWWQWLPGMEVLITALGFATVVCTWQYLLGVYQGHARHFAVQMGRLLAAVAIGGYVTYLALKAQGPDGHPSRLVAYAAIVFLGTLAAVRGSVIAARAARGTAKVLIVGRATEAQVVVGDLTLLEGPLPREVVGYFPTTREPLDSEGVRVPELNPAIPLTTHVRTHRVSEIIVAAKEQRGGVVPMDQLLLCRSMGVRVIDNAGFYEQTHGEVPLESLKASWLVYGPGFVQGRTRRLLKRSFDILASGTLLLLTAPVMLMAALLIKLESRGPVIYRQERVGLNGRTFTCMKFRSMVVDAERDGVAKWATKNDPRITRVGRFMRQTRIDELPQLISVLRSEMSLVGPRPERPAFVHHLGQQIAFYDLRHTVKPGITGWAQVRYAYGASLDDAKRKHQFDLYYVKNNSLMLDVLILLETIGVVLQRQGQ